MTQEQYKAINLVTDRVAHWFGIVPAIIHTQTRKNKPAHARHIVRFILYRYYGITYEQIGEALGSHRLNVSHSVKLIEHDINGISKNETTIKCVEYIVNILSLEMINETDLNILEYKHLKSQVLSLELRLNAKREKLKLIQQQIQ